MLKIVGVSGRQWVSLWVSVGVSGCQWVSVGVSGRQWVSVGVSGCVLVAPFSTGDFFEEWNEITPQTHIRKFEEHKDGALLFFF